jgi:hypothetical protein
MKFLIGDTVIRRGSEAQGRIIAMRDGKVKIYWTTHTTTWVNVSTLVHALPQSKGINTHG